ncbi:MAG: FixH family protein [Aquaticitalea sp.]
MKINWGTGIIIAFICFISFIMYFVIAMMTNEKYESDLVTENYYGQELEFQHDIDKQNNAKTLEENVSWSKTDEGIIITFPETLEAKDISGNVFLYRPSNKHLDFETTISLSNHNLLIPDNRLLGGRWNITVDWNYKDNSYMYKKEISY